jgi:hypothetical protein
MWPPRSVVAHADRAINLGTTPEDAGGDGPTV